MNKKIIFFDIGGTLLDAPDLFLYCSKELLKKEDKNFTKKLCELFLINHTEHYSGHSFLRVGDILDLSISLLQDSFHFEYHKGIGNKLYQDLYLNRSNLKKNAINVLSKLRVAGWTLMVTSDADADILYKELEIHNIKQYFDDFHISSQLGGYKPSQEFISVLKKTIMSDVKEIYVIGDSVVDEKLAFGLGISFIRFQNNPKKQLKENEINDLRQLLTILQ